MRSSDRARRAFLHVLGLNSGTSLDALDWALVRCAGDRPTVNVLAAGEVRMPLALRSVLVQCAQTEQLGKAALVRLDLAYGSWLGEQARRLVRRLRRRHGVDLIASHGQTVGHWPEGDVAATLQIGDPDRIAKRSGVPVVSHFRHGDLAAGGRGAPLTPAVNRILFARRRPLAVLNLGGIANLSLIPPRRASDAVRGTDCGPANLLLDLAARRLLGRPCDLNGATAARGRTHRALFAALRGHPWFARRLPASCGREEFGQPLLDRLHRRFRLAPPDFLATLTETTAWAVARANWELGGKPAAVYVTGGGVHNRALMTQLERYLAPVPVHSVAELGYDPDALEAVSFALLGYLFIRGRPVDLRRATGARQAAVLGRLALP